MFIELVDSLRCLEPHEETWLVAAASRMDGRHLIEGVLGCPVCRREYAIRDGTAWFSARQPDAAVQDLTTLAVDADPAHVTRTAALLDLSQPGGIVVLGGSWAAHADAVAELGAAHVVVLNARASGSSVQEVSSIVVDSRLPFGLAALRGVAIDASAASPALLSSAAVSLRARGRLVAPSDAPVPGDVEVLARDDHVWVAERRAVASPPIALRSVRR
ncbi:MAG TPA: hypothetical protein VFW03_10705 [Gemmatimonadaceae bacterium]|nr:hypothetical protein [Gemmatimonadaceae bacterium]